MPNLATVLKEEIRRLARKEVQAGLNAMKKQVAQHRRDLAALKRENADPKKKVAFLEKREKRRFDTASTVPKGTRFSVRSLKAQRRRTGLSQENYAKLVGVSGVSMHHWSAHPEGSGFP